MTAIEVREPPAAEHEPPAPPHDIHAEMCVLGGMMLTPDAIADVTRTLTPRDFYRPTHQAIYDKILDLYGRGQPVDVITVNQALGARFIASLGDTTYLHTLIHTVPTAANAGHYADIVAAKAVARRLVEAGTRIVQLGQNTDVDNTPTAVDRAQAEVYDVTNQLGNTHARTITSLLASTLNEIEARANGAFTGLATGFKGLDELLQGMQGGQLGVLAARPSIGKSTLGLDFCRHLSIKQGRPTVIFSMEMSESEIMLRLLSAEAKVNLSWLRSGKLPDDSWARLAEATERITDAPLHIVAAGGLTLGDIRTHTRRLSQQAGLELAVVDYLQLMTAADARAERQEQVAGFSRGLKVLAMDLDIPIVGISQLNRLAEQRTDKTPHLADLRESGAIENDANWVVLLHRPDFYDATKRMGEADLIVAKNRNGQTGTRTVAFQGHHSRFVDMIETH